MCVEDSSITSDTSSSECNNIFHVSVQKVSTHARTSLLLPEGRSAIAQCLPLCHGLRVVSIDGVLVDGVVTVLSCLVDMLTVHRLNYPCPGHEGIEREWGHSSTHSGAEWR